jgi:GAF domain-containing protein
MTCSGQGHRILLAHDGASDWDAWRIGLEKNGCEVVLCSPDEAPAHVTSDTNFYMVLLDADDGRAAERLKKLRKQNGGVPRVVLVTQNPATAHWAVMPPQKSSTLPDSSPPTEPPAYGYLMKPATAGEVWDLVSAAIGVDSIEGQIAEFEGVQGYLHKEIHARMDFGISVIDRSFRIRLVNPQQKYISREDACCGGVCWSEYNGDFLGKRPCPWCPVVKVFGDGQQHEATTVSTVKGQDRFFNVLAFALRSAEGEVVAAVELVKDCTDEMLTRWRTAVFEGRDVFGRAMKKVLEQVCVLRFDRARLFMTSGDPRFLDGLASVGEHAVDVRAVRLDLDKLPSLQADGKVREIRSYSEPPTEVRLLDPAAWKLRRQITPWIEVPLEVERPGADRFLVGTIQVDNEPGLLRDPDTASLERNQRLWSVLADYQRMLAPVLGEAREHWFQKERSHQLERLRQLDADLLGVDPLKAQLETFNAHVADALQAAHCHIRVRSGDMLVLAAHTHEYGRLREEVAISDASTSISASLAQASQPAEPLIWGEERLQIHGANLAKEGFPVAQEYFAGIRSCGAFAILDGNELVGTLVVDSRQWHFFDKERVDLLKDIVRRVGRAIALQRGQQQLANLLNTIPSAVAVIDRKAVIRVRNHAWIGRSPCQVPKASAAAQRFSVAAEYAGALPDVFDQTVEAVFQGGQQKQMVGEFLSAGGAKQKMDILIAPFERTAGGGVETVAVVLTDMSDTLQASSLSFGAGTTEHLSQSLRQSVRWIRERFKAARTSVAEVVSATEKESTVKLWCVEDVRGDRTAKDGSLQFQGVADLMKALRSSGFVAINDVQDSRLISERLQKAFLSKVGIRAVLAVPINLRGESWGVLVVGFVAPHEFSGKDVYLLQAAASQISLIILLMQQRQLRDIDRKVAEEIRLPRAVGPGPDSPWTSLLKNILQHAIDLTSSRGGHIRTVDRFTGDCVMEVAIGAPFMVPGRPPWRPRVVFGASVSGMVAMQGKPVVGQETPKLNALANIGCVPPDRPDILDWLCSEGDYACVPLVAEGEVLGMFSLSSVEPRHFTPGRMILLTDFAQHAAQALRAERFLERMLDLSKEIDPILDCKTLEELWPKIPEAAVRLFQAEDAVVSSYNNYTKLLRREKRYRGEAAVAIKGYKDQTAPPSDEPHSGFMRWSAKTGELVRLEGEAMLTDPRRSNAGPAMGRFLPSHEIRSVMVMPLRMPDEEMLGVLKVENRRWRLGNRGFTEFDEALMQQVCTKFAIAIKGVQLQEQRTGAFLSQTHDFKLPLQAIRGTLSNFTNEVFKLSNANHTRRLDYAYRYTKLLEAFVVNTLELGDQGKDLKPPVCEDVDPRTVVEEAIGFFEELLFDELLKEDKWKCAVQIPSCLKSVYADPNVLLRILVNLIDNARKHGWTSHTEGIHTEYRREMEVSVHTEGAVAIIEVGDRGPGIPPEYREAVFDIGFTLPSTGGGRKSTGHGVGLAGVRMLARRLGGDAKVMGWDPYDQGTIIQVAWDQDALRLASK